MAQVFGFVDDARKTFWEVKAREIAELMDPDTGRVYTHLTHRVNCAVCGLDDAVWVFSKQGFDFVKCRCCGLLYVNPQLKPEVAHRYYQKSGTMDHWMKVQLGEKEQEWNARSKYNPALEVLDRIRPQKGRLLDVGCSVGQFMKMAHDRGWEVEGIEVEQQAADYARKTFGFRVETELLENLDYAPESFDLVTLWGVLEHLADPREMLDTVRPLLKPDGLLLMFVPNGNSLVVRITREHNSTVSGRAHLWYFSPKTMDRMLAGAGYSTVRHLSVLSQLHEIVHFLQFNKLYHEPETLGEEEFELPEGLRRVVEKYILDNHMGYKLITIAGKAR